MQAVKCRQTSTKLHIPENIPEDSNLQDISGLCATGRAVMGPRGVHHWISSWQSWIRSTSCYFTPLRSVLVLSFHCHIAFQVICSLRVFRKKIVVFDYYELLCHFSFPDILLIASFLNILGVRSSVRARDRISRPCNTLSLHFHV
jgi:hypothetical protein